MTDNHHSKHTRTNTTYHNTLLFRFLFCHTAHPKNQWSSSFMFVNHITNTFARSSSSVPTVLRCGVAIETVNWFHDVHNGAVNHQSLGIVFFSPQRSTTDCSAVQCCYGYSIFFFLYPKSENFGKFKEWWKFDHFLPNLIP